MNKFRKCGKNNKGFTLVELIVVIVILAILIGVTIGGIYRYVGQARINTDINNAAEIEKLATTVYADTNELTDYAYYEFGFCWNDNATPEKIQSQIDYYKEMSETYPVYYAPVVFLEKLLEVAPNGLPKSQTGNGFALFVNCDAMNEGSSAYTGDIAPIRCYTYYTMPDTFRFGHYTYKKAQVFNSEASPKMTGYMYLVKDYGIKLFGTTGGIKKKDF